MLRTMLYEAAQSLLIHSRESSWLKAWGICLSFAVVAAI